MHSSSPNSMTVTPCSLMSSGFNRQRFRIDFKISLIPFKARLGLAPNYISEMLTPYEPSPGLRSSGGALLVVPQTRLKSKSDQTFF